MCARVSVKFRSWPTNQDTRGCNLVGKNRINNRINHIIFSLFFFLFFSYFLFGLKYHTTDKVNGRNKKESVSREHKNNLRKAIWMKIVSLHQRKIKLLAQFSHIVIFLFSQQNQSFLDFCQDILRNCQFNLARGEGKDLYIQPGIKLLTT